MDESLPAPAVIDERLFADDSERRYRASRAAHWDAVAGKMERWKGMGGAYHRRLESVYRFLVPPGQAVLEIGCGQGDLLAKLQPSWGVGVDFSSAMIARARIKHPEHTFLEADAHALPLFEGRFDVIILSDLINDVWDVQRVFARLRAISTPQTRIIINTYSRLWELPLSIVSKLGLAKPTLYQNWLTAEDTANLLRLEGIEVVRRWDEILFPLPIPLLGAFFNRFLAKIWPFHHLALTHFIVARALHPRPAEAAPPVVSVIVPARNEAGNIANIVRRVPEMGAGTEILFVEGNSTDGTYDAIVEAAARHPERRIRLLKQQGKGKGDAVRLGFAEAAGEILMILDADLTVPPEDLPRFCEALLSGKGEFINGVRLVYPMEEEAMRFFNLLGNKFFSLLFTWLLGQSIKDTLCGTKVLWREDYERIARNRAFFGDFDPFGDFDLIFGAAKLGLRIVDLPVRYRARTYGTTNIQRWKHGLLLLRMVRFAAGRIKFV